MDNLDIKRIEVSYTQYEIASIIEGIHDSLYRKVRWTVNPYHEAWHQLDFDIVLASIDSLSTAYMQSYMAFRQSIEDGGGEAISPEYEQAFIIPDNVWEVIDQIRSCEDWEEVEKHLHSETLCRTCRELARIPVS
jgi:hypothetical protein